MTYNIAVMSSEFSGVSRAITTLNNKRIMGLKFMIKKILFFIGISISFYSHADKIASEYHFDNGMKLIVKENHNAPVVVSQIWYKVGSSYEHSGITGVAHALEHMMFKGTPRYPTGMFSKIISENGGRENAFTGRDYTAYFQRLEKSRLAISFELEADRMKNIIVDKNEFAKEIKVVMEERRLRTEDKPQSLTYEQMMSAAYTSSPYHNPIIGWMDDLQNMQQEDLLAWYRQWYSPNNATLVVVGDVKSDAVYQLAKKYFSKLKPGKIPALKPRKEINQIGIREIIVKAPAKIPYLLMGYKTPSLKTAKESWEPYALEVLAGILDGGNSARLTKNLIRGNQITSTAAASYDIYSRLPNLFLLDATPSQGQTIDNVKKALFQEISNLKNQLVSEEELNRVKAQVVAQNVFEQDSMFYQAMRIGMLETIGLSWKLSEKYVKNIRAITAQQVQAVAQKYLIKDKLTIATLEPQPITKSNKRTISGGTRHGH